MTLFLNAALFVALAAPGPQEAPADPRAQAIAPFVDDEVVAVAHFDLSKLDVDALALRVLGGVADEDEIDAATQVVGGWVAALREAGARDLYALVSPADFPGPPVAVVPLVEGADAQAIGRVLCGGGEARRLYAWPTCATVGDAVFAGTDEALERIRRAEPTPRPEVDAAFAAAGESPVQVLIVPSAAQRRAFEELVPTLPRELGGGPFSVVSRGLRFAVIALEAEPKPALRVVVQAADPAAAQGLGQIITNALRLGAQMMRGQEDLGDLAAAIEPIRPEIAGDRLTIAVDLEPASALVGVPIRQAREAARRSQCANNLKQIGLAMHIYADGHKGTFPPAAITDDDGTPLLSWRVAILPYIEQKTLYDEFRLDEPWDSPHNKALIGRMPAIFYVCPSAGGNLAKEGRTTYLVPRGEATIFPGNEGVKIADVTDGTSNTILVVEVDEDQAVIWTKPEDWEIGENPDLRSLGSNHPRGANVLIADGSVRFLMETIDPAVFHKLLTRNGGEVISADEY